MHMITFKKWRTAMATLLLASPLGFATAQADGVTVDPPTGDSICLFSSLDLTKITYYDDNSKNAVQANLTTFGNPIVLKDTTYTTGVGTHAESKAIIKVNGATSFHARLGVDDEASTADAHGVVPYTISVYKDGSQETVMSGTIYRTDTFTVPVDIDLTDCDYLVLLLETGSVAWADQVSWANAYFVYTDIAPETADYVDTGNTVDIPEAAEGMENIPLSSLELENATCGWSTIQANKSIDGNAITLKDTIYSSGVGTHSEGTIVVKLNGSVTRFYTRVGIDDEVESSASSSNAICDYLVYLQAESGATQTVAEGTISGLDTTTPEIDVDVNGWKYLILKITNGSDGTNAYDHVDWANAYLEFQDQNSTRPAIISEDDMTAGLATAQTVFSQPGVRFMHKVRASSADAVVTVDGLPEGLTWNAERQIVDGTVEDEGEYTYYAHVTLDGTTTDYPISFTVSDDLSLPIPFMGWLSWNSVQDEVSEEIVQSVVTLFEENDLDDCGWNTIMLDDWWHASSRASDGKPQPNATRFPNGMASVADYVHNKGMKFGLYTDAASYTCAGAFGSYGYETIDANTYADWGIDIVKCDYCNAPSDVETAKTRYKALADAFNASGRDIMLYICEWGVREPWKWGAEVGGVCWRISQDVRDCWIGSGTGVGVTQSIDAMKDLAAYQGVNRFNDADMLCTGLRGTGKSSNDLCATGPGMTDDEYRTQFALWCMWSSPMALSFDPRNGINATDLAIIQNKEMIALNQDKMGQQADLISEQDSIVVFAKDLENGDVAIAIVNLDASTRNVTLDFSDIPALSVDSTYTCRDVQQQSAMDDVTGGITTSVKSHATNVFRLSLKSSIPSSISSPLSQQGFSIVGKDSNIVVNCPGTDDLSKRVIVCDDLGRVVATATSNASTITVPVKTGSGVYMTSVTCNAQSTSKKVKL